MTAVADLERALARHVLAAHPRDAVPVLAGAPADEVAGALATESAAVAAGVLGRMQPHRLAQILTRLPAELVRAAVPRLDIPRVTGALGWLDEPEREALLDAQDRGVARELRQLLSYPPETAGALMDPRVVAVRGDQTVREAIERLRDAPRELHQVYVVDDELELIGAVIVAHLALADPTATVASVAGPEPAAVGALASRDEVVDMLSRIGVPSIAVVDADGKLLGVLRYRALVGVAEQEAAAVMARMVGAGENERARSPARFAVKKRLPWLFINLGTAFAAASVVGIFEATIAQITALAVLLPVVAGQSGNAGAQALAVTMRGLALREVRASHWGALAFKETLVGVLNGVAIAVVCGIGVFFWSGSLGIAAVIAMSMVIAMAAAGLAGASIPVVLQMLGQDPAQASSIILTTVTDIVGFMSFLGLASALLL